MLGKESDNPYRLTVVKSGGDYLVNFYSEVRDERRATLPEVIHYIFGLNSLSLAPEPMYSLPDQEKEVLEAVRIGLLQRGLGNQRIPLITEAIVSESFLRRVAGETETDIL